MLIKQGSLSPPRNVFHTTFVELQIYRVFSKGKSALAHLFDILEILSSASNKAKILDVIFCDNNIPDDSCSFLPAFPSRVNMKSLISL